MKSPRLKQWLQNLALMFGTFLFCVAGFEIILRVAGYGNVEIYQPDSRLYWRLKPNQDCLTKIDRKPVHINSLGTRGPEFNPDKPADTIRILALGDSKTFGWGLTEDESYSGLLNRHLQEVVGGGRKVEVINAGVNAWSYHQMLVYLREFALPYKLDYVLIGDANLWTQFSDSTSPEFVKSFLRRVWLKNFLRRFAIYHYVVEVKLKEVYERTRSKFVPVDPKQDTLFKEQQQQDPNAFFKTTISNLCTLALTNGIQPVLLYIPFATDLNTTNQPAVREIKTELSRELGIPLLDFTEDFAPKGDTIYLEADPVHPNVEGNEMIARRLFQTMTNLMSL